MKDKKNKFCQSCGIPFDKAPEGHGTKVDGSECEKYCSYCYQKGEFTQKIDNVKEYQKYVISKMRENGYGRISSWLLTRMIPMLERWKK